MDWNMKYIYRLISIITIFCLFASISFVKAVQNSELIISQKILNFDRCTKNSIPALKFTVSSQNEGLSQVNLKPSQDWIHLSTTSFKKQSQEVTVTIDPLNLTYNPGLYLEKIEIV